MFVSAIHTVWQNKYQRSLRITRNYSPSELKFNKGDEIGHFAMGSTIILLIEKQLNWQLILNNEIKMGDLLAKI